MFLLVSCFTLSNKCDRNLERKWAGQLDCKQQVGFYVIGSESIFYRSSHTHLSLTAVLSIWLSSFVWPFLSLKSLKLKTKKTPLQWHYRLATCHQEWIISTRVFANSNSRSTISTLLNNNNNKSLFFLLLLLDNTHFCFGVNLKKGGWFCLSCRQFDGLSAKRKTTSSRQKSNASSLELERSMRTDS